MPIPNAASAWVPAEKLRDYLLNEQHPVGGSKARWFRSVGFDADAPDTLGRCLLELVRHSDDYSEKSAPFGTKYVVSGKIKTPRGDEASIVSVWIVEPSDNRPRLVTAYPGDKT